MWNCRRTLLATCSLVAVVLSPDIASAISFTAGHFYGSDYSVYGVSEYDSSGKFLGHLGLWPLPTRGLAFGPDHLVYVVSPDGNGFKVNAMNSDGLIQQSYPYPERQVAGSAYAGKITFDGSGHFYVQGVRFTLGNPNSADPILPVDTQDLSILPDGNLLVIRDHQLGEYDPTGLAIGDPIEVPTRAEALRGIAFDPQTNSIYLSVWGFAGEFARVIQMDRATGELLNSLNVVYPSDLWLSTDGRLIVGNAASGPLILTKSLGVLGQFEDTGREFVAEYVPEPDTRTLCLIASIVLAGMACGRRQIRTPS